jgi:two-component system phosphate regulon sensor histidine kinase PhoR
MARKRFFAQLFPWFLFVTLAPLAIVVAITWKVVEDFHMEQTRTDLLARVELFRLGLEPVYSQGAVAVDRYCKQMAARPAGPDGFTRDTRFTIVGMDGVVLGDSIEIPASMENHSDRPEVREAKAGRTGVNERFSDTLRKRQLYMAVPMTKDGAVIGVVRASFTVDAIHGVLLTVTFRILIVGLLTGLVSVGIGLFASRLLTEPLEEMEHGARRFAEGDLKARVGVPDSLELANLAEGLNRMARLLDGRIQTETRQRREREAVLASMDEGVLALDLDQKILEINAAAARLLAVDAAQAPGRSLLEVVRNPELERFVTAALAADTGLEGDLVLQDEEDMYVQLRGTPLKGHEEQRIGILVVFNDVTRLRRLETVRREFVSNASHELRTPITSIRGFAETLVESVASDPEAARRFAGIIEAQACRLETLVEDMLTLSRLEHESEREKLTLERLSVAGVLRAAAVVCGARAEARKIQLDIVCPDGLEVAMAGSLMEQAVVNLLDNAIKYSDEGAAVTVVAETSGDRLAIRVRDRGCGIEKKHLPRLFERFYRVDNARSRKLGGTGLGLAIVKHIVLAHGGEVGVTSAPGEGSEFTIRLPLPTPA